jgi:hypothetical protein
MGKFALHFNKAVLTEANLCKLQKETFLTGSVLNVKQSGEHRNMRMSVLLWKGQFFDCPENP